MGPPTKVFSPLPSLLATDTSSNTEAVSSTPPPAQPDSTTPSPSLDTETRVARTTTSSETPGDPDGVTRATSRSLLAMVLVSAVANKALTSPPPLESIHSQQPRV